MVYKRKNKIIKKKTQHEIPQNRINKIRGKYNKQKKKSENQTPVNSNSCVSHKSMTLKDNMVLDTSDDAGTNADTSNNKDMPLKVLNNNCTTSITTNDDINSMDIANNDTSTLARTDNNANSDINNYTVGSNTHMEEEDDIVRKIMDCIPKEYYVSANNNGLPNNNYLSKGAWEPDENHMKALDESSEVEQAFYCEFCNGICEQSDHYQFNQWYSLNENLKCYVCYQEFFDKKRLQLHENEHVKLHIC